METEILKEDVDEVLLEALKRITGCIEGTCDHDPCKQYRNSGDFITGITFSLVTANGFSTTITAGVVGKLLMGELLSAALTVQDIYNHIDRVNEMDGLFALLEKSQAQGAGVETNN